ncbi:MAG: DUF6691 family protein [Halobacteriales archaeon]|nr:DUF6691 family protein [Halobacteriales archaeon]
MTHRRPAFWAVVFAGGLVFGLGLAVSQMVRPEVVLTFLRLEDLGLLLVMGGASVTLGVGLRVVPALAEQAPITGALYGRRHRTLDRNVLVGGAVFGAGWGLSGVCPGAAYASLGVGNWPILWAVAGMFVGAYAHGYWRSVRAADPAAPAAD